MATNLNAKQTKCIACGAIYLTDAKYCGVDGTALRALTVENEIDDTLQTEGKQRCPMCGRLLPSYARYCPGDGSELVDKDAPISSAESIASDKTSLHHNVIFKNEDDEVIGKVFANKYKIEKLLGEGGMAKVYAAMNTEIEKQVVIKLMRQQLPAKDKETSLKRFLQEIKVTAKLNHPNLVSLFDGGEIEGRPFLVMEYIPGESLRQFITLETHATFSDAITIILQACAGLQEAHSKGIIHRDLKPENIMLREDTDRPDWVKIVDFGIAHLKQGGSKLTATGIAIGTVDYMSPEYLADKPIDARTDIYALGIILHELLTGHCPFEASSAEAVMMKHLWTTPMPPSASRPGMNPGCALDRIVEKSLQKEPDARYQSVAEMRKDLQKALIDPAN
jgi:serine/threonine protein kinase